MANGLTPPRDESDAFKRFYGEDKNESIPGFQIFAVHLILSDCVSDHPRVAMAPNSTIYLTRHAQAEHNVDLDYSSMSGYTLVFPRHR